MADVATESLYPTPFANSPLLPLLLMSLAVQRHTPVTRNKFKDEYDFIVVGAGTAGAVVASRLSEIKCVDVLLLEAGDDPPLLTEVPASVRSFITTDIDWQFITEPQKYALAGHVNRQTLSSAGRVIGGSSVLTGRVTSRGNPRNFDDWAAQGAIGWSYKEVFPYFVRMEDNPEFVETGYHGIGGPITMETSRNYTILNTAIMEATTNMGYEVIDLDGPLQTGFVIQQASVRDGQSCSSAKGYLVPSENRPNLDILKNARVTKVLIDRKRAIGVEFDDEKGYRHTIRARREVILAAGAINTAKLLMLSGIGPFQELTKHSIQPIVDLPVGQNLQDHISTLLFYDITGIMEDFTDQVTDERNINDYIRNRKGPLTVIEGLVAATFLNKQQDPHGLPDFGVYALFYSETNLIEHALWDPELVEQLLGPYRDRVGISCVAEILNPQSRGYVQLRSAHPYDPPIVDPNYFSNPEDLETMVAALKNCRRIFESPSVQKLGVRPFQTIYPGCENFTRNEDMYLRCVARTAIFSLYHPVGTTKMGNPLDPTTVVDPLLRVKNIKGLRVVDASIMPTITWANPLNTVTMIGEKAADIIKATVKCI